MKRALLLALLLVGCGQDNNHGHGFHFDEQGATGIRVRYFDETSPRLEFVERMYRETMECVGVTAPGPLVIWSESVVGTDGGNVHGTIFFDTGTILADNDACLGNVCKALAYQGHVLKHEFVHWLLHWAGHLTLEQHRIHAADEFTSCTNVVIQ